MIEVDLSLVFTLYLLLVLAIFFLLWIYQEGKKRFKSLDEQEKYLWQCSICAFIYFDPKEDHLSRCPCCQSFNKRMQEISRYKDMQAATKAQRHRGTKLKKT